MGIDKEKATHGIRKDRAAMFKENSPPTDKRMAVLGHETEEEATRYSKSADLRRIIDGTEKFRLFEEVPIEHNNPLKNKGNNLEK